MLQVLQYLVGTSIAAFVVSADLIIVHWVVGGPNANGSWESSGGKGCKFRGKISLMLGQMSKAPHEKTYPWICDRSMDKG